MISCALGRISRSILALSLLLASTPTVNADTPIEAASLRGLASLHVLVEYLPESAKQLGISEDTLRTFAELKLRQNGITVTDANGSLPYLYVNLTVAGSPKPVAASLEISIVQPARLLRDNSLILATTWDVSETISIPDAKSLREGLADLVDRFLNAWLSVNPKSR